MVQAALGLALGFRVLHECPGAKQLLPRVIEDHFLLLATTQSYPFLSCSRADASLLSCSRADGLLDVITPHVYK